MGPYDNSAVREFGDLYLVHSDGRIWSKKKGAFLAMWPNNKGYLMVSVYGRKRTVHRIIAECFLPNEAGAATVNHKNGERADNRVENLEWCSYGENNQHAWDMKRDERVPALKESVTGSKNPFAKLTEEQVREIRAAYVPKTPGLRQEFADKYGVSVGTIKNVVSNRWWKHV